jgi:hypothetical protein
MIDVSTIVLFAYGLAALIQIEREASLLIFRGRKEKLSPFVALGNTRVSAGARWRLAGAG